MKRTPLTRKTPMQRKPMKKRTRRKGDKPEVRYAFMEEHQACAATWARAGQFGVVLHCHHLVAGSGRKDDPRNLLALEQWVHDHYHSGGVLDEQGNRLDDLTPGHLLWIKRECDVENYDEAFICELLGRQALPANWEPARPPAWVFQMRERSTR